MRVYNPQFLAVCDYSEQTDNDINCTLVQFSINNLELILMCLVEVCETNSDVYMFKIDTFNIVVIDT